MVDLSFPGRNEEPANLMVCLDKSTGLPLFSQISLARKSELDDKEESQKTMSFTATSFSDKVDDSVFNLPENTCYSLGTKEKCDSSKLNCDWNGKACEKSRSLPSKCVMQSGLACLDYKATANSLAFAVRNSFGYDISIDAVEAQQCTPLGSQGTLAYGAKATYTLKCAIDGSKYNGQFNVTFTTIETGIQHTSQGQISTRLV